MKVEKCSAGILPAGFGGILPPGKKRATELTLQLYNPLKTMYICSSPWGETFVAWESNKRNSASPKARRAERAGASESQTGEGDRPN